MKANIRNRTEKFKEDITCAEAFIEGNPMKGKDREVRTDGHTVTAFLHRHKVLSREDGSVTVYGDAICTRKTCRFINRMLLPLTGFRVESRNGRWMVRNMKDMKTRRVHAGTEMPLPVLV